MSDNWKMQDDASMPIGTGGENTTPETSFVPQKKPKVQAMTLALITVFLGGLALIYAVGVLHHPRSAEAGTETESQINVELKKLEDKTGNGRSGNIMADTDRLVKMFYQYPGQASLPLEKLPTNPFEQPTGPAVIHETPHGYLPVVDPNAEENALVQKLAGEVAQMKLQSVIVSSGLNAAQINGRLLTVGAKVGEFTIEKIESKRVTVRSGTHAFDLLLDQPKIDQP